MYFAVSAAFRSIDLWKSFSRKKRERKKALLSWSLSKGARCHERRAWKKLSRACRCLALHIYDATIVGSVCVLSFFFLLYSCFKTNDVNANEISLVCVHFDSFSLDTFRCMYIYIYIYEGCMQWDFNGWTVYSKLD